MGSHGSQTTQANDKPYFYWMPKVSRDCIDFSLLHSVIGPENLHLSLEKSDEKLIDKAEEEEWNQVDEDVKKKLPIVENPGGR